MPRAGGRRRRGVGWKDHRRRGIGIVSIPTAERNIASDVVDDVFDLLSASSTIGGATEGIATKCVNEVFDMLTVQYP